MRLPRALAAVLTLFGASAFAQINPLIPLQITYNNLSTYTYGADQCGGMVVATWTATLRGTPCNDMQVWITQGECGDAPVTSGQNDQVLASVPSTVVLGIHTGTITVNLADVPTGNIPYPVSYDGGVDCGAANTELDYKLCAAIPLQSSLTCIVNHATPLAIVYDTEPPTAPAITNLVVKDSALTVTVSNSSDTDFVYLQAMGGADTDFGHDTQIIVADTETGTIQGLQDGVSYQVRAYAVDAAGNASGFSDVQTATPLHSTGFWDAYRTAGGGEQGCAAAGAGPVLLGVLMLLFRRRGHEVKQ
jgi:hypothetical protein